MRPLKSIYHTIRIVGLLGLLVVYSSGSAGCFSHEATSTPISNDFNPTQRIEPSATTLFIDAPDRMVGNKLLEFTPISPHTIPPLTELEVYLESSNNASFLLYGKDSKPCGPYAKLSDLTSYNDRYQKDMTLPVQMGLDQPNGEEKATVKITIQQHKQGTKVLIAQKTIHWVQDGINLSLKPNYYIASDQGENGKIIVSCTNIGNKPVDLTQVMINSQCTDFELEKNFMLGNVSTQKVDLTLAQVTGLRELGSFLSTQVIISPCAPLKDQAAVGLMITLLEDKTQEITSIPLIFCTDRMRQIKEAIYQLIGEHGEKLDSLQEGEPDKLGWLVTCKSRLAEGVATCEQLLHQLAAIQESNPYFGAIIRNLIPPYDARKKEWEAAIQKITQHIQKDTLIEKLTQRSIELQQELSKIPDTIQEKTKILQLTSNLKDITNMVLAGYNRELPVEQQSIHGLYQHATYLAQEFNTIKKTLGQQGRPMDVNPSVITNQVKAIERQAQCSLKGGFEKYKSTLWQQQDISFSQSDLTEQTTKNRLASQLWLQASTLGTWINYIRNKKDQSTIEEDILYIVQAYEKVAQQARILAKACSKDPDYPTMYRCADLVSLIVHKVNIIAQSYNNNTIHTSTRNICETTSEIWKRLEKLKQIKGLPTGYRVRWAHRSHDVYPSKLTELNNLLKNYK